jgi:hypothetical protein
MPDQCQRALRTVSPVRPAGRFKIETLPSRYLRQCPLHTNKAASYRTAV